jgi:hypothetical protein
MSKAKTNAKRRTSGESKSAAAKRADEIRERIETARAVAPGSVVNAEEGWSYKFVGKDASKRVKSLSKIDLESKGYEKCEDPNVSIAGMPGAEIWQVPIETALLLKKIKTEERQKRDKQNRRGNILGR